MRRAAAKQRQGGADGEESLATQAEASVDLGWRRSLPEAVRPYTEAAPIAAFFLGVSSGFPYAMIGATLTTRLAQDGIDKKTVTAFTLVFLAYNFKFLWAWIVDGVRLPLLGRLGQRVSWMLVMGALVIAAVVNLALQDPARYWSRASSAWAQA
jgi:PAT family beta-lactamase induction signal transducer AmpG